MSIDDATLAKARAAWDACLQQEREAQEAQQRLTATRKEVAAFHRRMAAAWENLSEEARAQVAWTAQHTDGAAPIEAALLTLQETAETVLFEAGRKRRAHYSGVSLEAIRAVARALGIRSYGSSQRAKPLPDESQLLAVCEAFDARVTLRNVRNALKTRK
ncbi:hypothetical protein P2Q70_01310 [Pseudomonas mendocina]|uniref:hypothetical protein n=1 Tax=Ectopseudomonas mendocina TaxID=300 RepID=UPI0023DA53D8|nr:hypothetical protein [Pseudomonas mendocina]MDF2073209.1 hypothetical protein [Pseudomonas mendocina]